MEPLHPGTTLRPKSGSLFRVWPNFEGPDHVVSLDTAMVNLDWARNVERDGFLIAGTGEGRTLALSGDFAYVLSPTHGLTFPRTMRQIASLMHMNVADISAYLPAERFDDVAYRGKAVSLVLAVEPRDTDQSMTTGRDLGAELCFQYFASFILTVDDFLERLDVRPPPGFCARLEGFSRRVGGGRYRPQTGDAVMVWMERQDGSGNDESSDSDSGDPGPDEGPHGPSGARDRGPSLPFYDGGAHDDVPSNSGNGSLTCSRSPR